MEPETEMPKAKKGAAASGAKSIIITPNLIASYPHLVTPRANERGQDRWEMCCVFPPSSDIKPMKQAAMAVLMEHNGNDQKKVTSLIKSGKLHWPFTEADAEDVERKGYPEGSTIVNMRSTRPVGVVSRVKDANGQPTQLDPSAIYPGCIVKVSCDAYWFSGDKKKGVTFGLRNVQFVEDGDRLDGVVVTSAADDFEADLEVEEADLSALEADEGAEDEDDDLDEIDDLLK